MSARVRGWAKQFMNLSLFRMCDFMHIIYILHAHVSMSSVQHANMYVRMY